jgi:hypothetical protein
MTINTFPSVGVAFCSSKIPGIHTIYKNINSRTWPGNRIFVTMGRKTPG